MRKETQHVAVAGLQARINNNRVERYHNNFREFDKIRRGWKDPIKANVAAKGYGTYHNFVHKHMTLGKTPAEAAGIELNLNHNKWLGLIKQASRNRA